MGNTINKHRLFLVLIFVCLFCSFTHTENHTRVSEAENEHPRIVNIVNFIRLLEPRDAAITEDVLYQTVVQQVRIMKKYRLKGSFLLQYDALLDPRYQQLLKQPLLPHQSIVGKWPFTFSGCAFVQ